MNSRKFRRTMTRRNAWSSTQEIIVAVLTETKFLAAQLSLEREDDAMDYIKKQSNNDVGTWIEATLEVLLTGSEQFKTGACEMIMRLFIELARRRTEIVNGIPMCRDTPMLCCSIFKLHGGGLEKRIIGLRNVPDNIINDGLRMQSAVEECLMVSPVMRSVALSDYASDSAIHEYLS